MLGSSGCAVKGWQTRMHCCWGCSTFTMTRYSWSYGRASWTTLACATPDLLYNDSCVLGVFNGIRTVCVKGLYRLSDDNNLCFVVSKSVGSRWILANRSSVPRSTWTQFKICEIGAGGSIIALLANSAGSTLQYENRLNTQRIQLAM